MPPNKFMVSSVVCADLIACCGREELDQYVEANLINDLSAALVDEFPIEVTPSTETGLGGTTGEEHKLTLFIFSEQQLNVYIEKAARQMLFDRAAAKALQTLPERVVN